MLKVHATEFLAYGKVVGFSSKSRESLAASLREFDAFLATQPGDSPKAITYGLLADFVADFRGPPVHKKKARAWCLGLRISELTGLTVGSFEPDHDPENRIGLLRVRG